MGVVDEMIVDTIDNVMRYIGLGNRFATAFRYIAAHDLFELPLGKTMIDGDAVYANHGEGELTGEEKYWEAHGRYADIQIIIKGRERFGWGASGEYGEYEPEKDYYPCYHVDAKFVNLTAGQFCIFLPKEPHSPGNYIEKAEHSEKVIIKILMDN